MNKLVEKVKDGKIVLGTWITINSPEIAEALSNLGLDWVVIDMEHAPLDIYSVEMILMGLKGSETIGIVRVPWNDFVIIKRVLDIGAQGILVPWVNDKKEAEEVIRACTYPPRGIRGFGPRRATLYGLRNTKEYFQNYLKDLVILIQVETVKSVENLDEILSIPEITGIFVGPRDLSVSMGIYGEFDNPKFIRTLEKISEKAKAKKSIIGIMTYNPEQALRAISIGYNFISLSSDMNNLIKSYKKFISYLK